MTFKSLGGVGKKSRFIFKTPAGVRITDGYGRFHDLSATYRGREIPSEDIKNTRFFLVDYNITEVVSLGDSIFIGSDSWLITSIKWISDHTEIIGLKASAVVSPTSESGIVSWWRFSSSETLGDDFQGSNPLSIINGGSHTSESGTGASPQDGSIEFESDSFQRAEISDGDQQSLDITGDITIVARIKLESVADVGTIVSKWNGATSNQSYRLEVTVGSKLRGGLSSDGSGSVEATGDTTLSTGTWYSVALVYDATDIRLYLDGSLDSNGSQNPKTYSAGIFNGASKFVIGARGNNQDYFDGLIDDVQIFNESKSAAKISTWHSTGAW